MCVYTVFWQGLQPPRLEGGRRYLASIGEKNMIVQVFSQIAQAEVAYSKEFQKPFWIPWNLAHGIPGRMASTCAVV